MKANDRRMLVAGAALMLFAGGCTTTNAAGADETAAAAEPSGAQAEQDEAVQAESEADSSEGEAGSTTAQAGDAGFVPGGFEVPQSCPDVLDVTMPDEEMSLSELNTWFCERFDRTASPSYAVVNRDVKLETHPNSCGRESVASQGATRSVTRSVSCFDEQGREFASFRVTDSGRPTISLETYGEGEHEFTRFTNAAGTCTVERRVGDTKLFLRMADGALDPKTKTVYDGENREVRQVTKRNDGSSREARHEYTSSESERTKTSFRGDVVSSKTVESLREDGTIEKETKIMYSDGQPASKTVTTFDEQGRAVEQKPVAVNGKTVSLGQRKSHTYQGSAEHPVETEIVNIRDGDESWITISYELEDGDPVSSTITFPDSSIGEEFWRYDGDVLVATREAGILRAGASDTRFESHEFQYDESGRMTERLRYFGEKDNPRDSKWTTTLTYSCME